MSGHSYAFQLKGIIVPIQRRLDAMKANLKKNSYYGQLFFMCMTYGRRQSSLVIYVKSVRNFMYVLIDEF